ncbi:MAG: cobalamin B12-binding domain-containing protein [Bacteroidales bacterium]
MDSNLVQYPHLEFLNALISGNRKMSSEIAQKYMDENNSIKALYEIIIRNALYDIGELWEKNKISVATEHLASAIVEAILNEQYSKINNTLKIAKTVIVACVENEFHQIGLKMINDIFELNGWNSYFLGANTSTTELISFAKTIQPDIIALSLSLSFNFPVLEMMIQRINSELPGQMILIGGQSFRNGSQYKLLKYDKVFYQPDLSSTEFFIEKII